MQSSRFVRKFTMLSLNLCGDGTIVNNHVEIPARRNPIGAV
jgi:hypothetical protein